MNWYRRFFGHVSIVHFISVNRRKLFEFTDHAVESLATNVKQRKKWIFIGISNRSSISHLIARIRYERIKIIIFSPTPMTIFIYFFTFRCFSEPWSHAVFIKINSLFWFSHEILRNSKLVWINALIYESTWIENCDFPFDSMFTLRNDAVGRSIVCFVLTKWIKSDL